MLAVQSGRMSVEISQFLQSRIDAGDFPSAVYLIAEKGEIVFRDALGYAVVEPERIKATDDTIYDLASLTKPLITGLLAAKVLDDGNAGLDDSLQAYLSADVPEDKREITIRELATHTSGLPAWVPFYLRVGERSSIVNEILRTPLADHAPNVIYSDLNFLLLAEAVIAKRSGGPLQHIARQLMIEPLRLERTFFNPPGSIRPEIAASEKGNEYEKQTCIELGYFQPPATLGGSDMDSNELRTPHSAFRNRLIWGEVHDGNAWFMGGVAGHAGLFSTAEETFKIAFQFLPNYTTILKPETCELFRTNFTPGMNEHRSFAFQLASTPESTAGTLMSPKSFGHLGFTGTSLWIDPVKERIFILLTNRTHGRPLPFVNINSVRRHFHDLAVEQLDNK